MTATAASPAPSAGRPTPTCRRSPVPDASSSHCRRTAGPPCARRRTPSRARCGLRFEHPLVARSAGWLRAGGLANHIEIENADGDLVQDTGHGLGWEVGGGLTVPIGPRLALVPGLRHRTLARDISVGGPTRSSTLSYVTTGIGLAYTF